MARWVADPALYGYPAAIRIYEEIRVSPALFAHVEEGEGVEVSLDCLDLTRPKACHRVGPVEQSLCQPERIRQLFECRVMAPQWAPIVGVVHGHEAADE